MIARTLRQGMPRVHVPVAGLSHMRHDPGLYGYAGANPISRVDPRGEHWLVTIGVGIGLIAQSQ